jgi:hypothetical protein
MRIRTVIAVLAALFTAAPAAYAQSPRRPDQPQPPGGINTRQDRQMDRIRAGRRAGEITDAELRRLHQLERHIQREEQRLRRSGDGLSRREFGRIQRDLNQANRAIRRSIHNRRHRG